MKLCVRECDAGRREKDPVESRQKWEKKKRKRSIKSKPLPPFSISSSFTS